MRLSWTLRQQGFATCLEEGMKKLSTEVTLGYSEIIEALPSDILPPGTREGPHRAYPPRFRAG
jgi:hypothetical protein